jgi:hypothetical protein
MPTWYVTNAVSPTYTTTSTVWTDCWLDNCTNGATSTSTGTATWCFYGGTGDPTGSVVWYDDGQRWIALPVTVRVSRQQRPVYHVPLQEAAQRWELKRHTDKARRRAERLLLSHLTGEQRASFKKNKWFIVEGGQSKRRYRIRDRGNLVANIDVLDGDAVAHRLCGHCRAGDLPLADHLLAQKMMLEMAEDEFLKIANRHAA